MYLPEFHLAAKPQRIHNLFFIVPFDIAVEIINKHQQGITFETVIVEAFIFHATQEPLTGCIIRKTVFFRHGPC
jgi:hypothetical protein